MSDKFSFIKEETRKRCNVFELDEKTSGRFTRISTELFHFLYETKSIDFTIYFRIENVMIEFIKKEEFSEELLNSIWTAVEKSSKRIEICLLKKEKPLFDALVSKVRKAKMDKVFEIDSNLDRRTMEMFSNLSDASQLVVKGGITHQVAKQIQESATFVVKNMLEHESAISTLSKMVLHDPTLYDHSASVAMLSAVIAKGCVDKKLSDKEVGQLTQCGLYHDVGKTCVPSKILNKPGKFTPEEYEVMKKHAEWGEEELRKVIQNGAPIDEMAAHVAGEHHERFCGHGYPKGLKGRAEEVDGGIHLYTRIVSIADVYSALLMKRVYKPAFEAQDAIKIMAKTADVDYDPVIFGNFLQSVVNSRNQYQEKSSGSGRILTFDENGKLQENAKKVV